MNPFQQKYTINLFLMSLLFVLPFYGNSNSVSVSKMAPVSPAKLNFRDKVTISFSYKITEARGARIFIRPITNERLTPNYSASGSPIYNGEGNATATFTITAGETEVEQLRVQVLDATQLRLIFEFHFPVNYSFSVGIRNLSISDRVVGRDIRISDRRAQPQRVAPERPENITSGDQESQSPTKKILPDGKIQITYPDGRVVIKYKGGYSVYDPTTGQTSSASYSTQARAVIPPSVPGDAEMTWMVEHSKNLLSIIEMLVNFDAASIDNYLQVEGDQDIYNQIVTREETISYMITP